MDRISELLDKVDAPGIISQNQIDVRRWMVEATNRIQELEYAVSTLQNSQPDTTVRELKEKLDNHTHLYLSPAGYEAASAVMTETSAPKPS